MNSATLWAAALLALQEPPPRDLADLSLEELMRLEVTTAGRKEQHLMDVAAAVTVIRGEDLRRLGARSIPEALRLAPGANAARIDGHKWAVGIRGFSDRFANKLQVLIDGRSVYTPLFSGVFWEQQDVFLEDIDRIEVIRGPGGAVWGANAVNGVINIITKEATETRGVLAYAGGGTEERAFGGVRYGGAAGEDVFYRAYAKGADRDAQHGPEAEDESWTGRAGFRTKWVASEVDTLTLLGDVHQGRFGTRTVRPAPPPIFVADRAEHYAAGGGHLLARWERRLDDGGLLSAQTSYARTRMETSFHSERRDTMDVDVTHRLKLFEAHDVLWGVGYRLTADAIDGSFGVRLDPKAETDDVASVFLQDEIALAAEALKLTLGARAEYNDYTQLELQPSARLAFRVHEKHLLWAAVSRAVRTPSRGENDIGLIVAVFPVPNPAPPPPAFVGEFHVLGDRDLEAEELLAYEAGYRVQPSDDLSFDLALFYNDYDRLRTVEPAGTLSGPPLIVDTARLDNRAEARTYGAELAVTWQAAEGVRLYGAFSLLRINIDPDDSGDAVAENPERNDAKGQAFVRASVDLSRDVELDLLGRYVGPLGNRDVDAYAEMDVRLGWRPSSALELSLVGQSLLHDEHFESGATGLGEQATEIERGVYLMVRWDY